MTQPAPERIPKMGFGFWSPRVLLSAVEMGLFTEPAEKPGDLAQLRSRFGLHPRSAEDFLDALVALKLLRRESGVYRNTPETDLWLGSVEHLVGPDSMAVGIK